MKVKFNRDVNIEGSEFKQGAVYDSECEDKPIPAGNLTSMLGVSWIEEACEEPEPVAPEPVAEVAPEPAKEETLAKEKPVKKKPPKKVRAVPNSDIESDGA